MTKILIDEALVRQWLVALEANSLLVNGDDKKGGLAWCMDGYYSGCFDIEPVNKQTNEAIEEIRQALANAALDKMADNARELGLSYEQPIPSTMKQAIIEEASIQMTGHPSKDARCFAKSVYEYLMAEQPAQQEPEFASPGGGYVPAIPAPRPAPAQEPDPDELTIAYMSGLYEGKKRKPFIWLTNAEIAELKILPGANRERTATEMAFAVRDKLMEKNA